MCPRPRTVDDAEILAAIGRVIGRFGPARLTLARVAEDVGLSPAALIQRFGSKRELLIAFAESGRDDPGNLLARLREQYGSPLAVLREFLLCFAHMASTAEEMANHLAFFQMDVIDPDMRLLALEVFDENETTVVDLLSDALVAGELTGCSPEEFAPILLTVAQGSLLNWAIYREGTARDWIARHVEVTLRPYISGSPDQRSPS